MSRRVWKFVVEVPEEAGEQVADTIYDAITDAVGAVEPEERDGWDVFIYGVKEDVPDDEEIEKFAREIELS